MNIEWKNRETVIGKSEDLLSARHSVSKPYVSIRGEVLLDGYNILLNGDYKYTWENITIELSQNIDLE